MEDPFSTLLKSLQSLFHWEAMRNDKYTNPLVQQLKEATDNYDPKLKHSFIKLLEAVRVCSSRMKIWHVNFDSVRKSMDTLATLHKLPRIDWITDGSNPKGSAKFQFSAQNPSPTEISFSDWLSKKAGKPYTQLHHKELTQVLVTHHDRHGFSQKLSGHLKKYPDFLFQLIMESEKNFIKICNNRLILYLTDQQIAKAIVKHIPALVHKKSDPFAQVDQLVHTLNDILSNGRSVSTLLRNAEAKPILYNSIFFQIYQSDDYQNRTSQPQGDTPLQSYTPKRKS